MENEGTANRLHICRRCGRKLRSESSKEKGMGPSCYSKWVAEHGHKKLFSIPPLQTSQNSV